MLGKHYRKNQYQMQSMSVFRMLSKLLFSHYEENILIMRKIHPVVYYKGGGQ